MAEQNCRKSAEARLDAELRKLYKLQAQSQELAFANTKLQQQLKTSKNAVKNPLPLAAPTNVLTAKRSEYGDAALLGALTILCCFAG